MVTFPGSGDTAKDTLRVSGDHAVKPVADPRPVKKTTEQINAAVLAGLREMVRLADAAGQRDAPHVVKAKEALALLDGPVEPKPAEPPKKHDWTPEERAEVARHVQPVVGRSDPKAKP